MNFYTSKHRGKTFIDNTSPSGEYKLVVTSYSTKKGCWDISQGIIYKTSNNKQLFEIQRNYSSFPYSWITHPNSHQYLIYGADYQGQTILELDTGKRKDFIPDAAKKGVGFCWVQYRFDIPSKILTVCGCVWACPYEFRFYDFSDPINGWPELQTEENIDDDNKWPTFQPDGTIKTYSTNSYDDDEENTQKPEIIKATKTFIREDLKLRLLNEDVTEEEKLRRQKNEESWRLYNEKISLFKKSDPLFLLHEKLIKDHKLSPENHYGIGQTHNDWCPHFKTIEQRFCRRIVKKDNLTIDLEWAMQTGPIKLIIYKKDKHFLDKWFEHSIIGMEKAFNEMKEQLNENKND